MQNANHIAPHFGRLEPGPHVVSGINKNRKNHCQMQASVLFLYSTLSLNLKDAPNFENEENAQMRERWSVTNENAA